MSDDEVLQEEEISLFELFEKLREGWRTVVGGTALGIAGAVLAIAVTPPRYEAVAIVQVGQVGQAGQAGQAGQGKVNSSPVEAPIQTVERMKTPAFQRRVAEALGDREWLGNIARSNSGMTNDLALQIIKATAGSDRPLIELRASGSTPEAAQKKAEAAVVQLIGVHDALAQPALAQMRAELAVSRDRLASAERDLQVLAKMATDASIKDERFTQVALMTSLRIQKEEETFIQRQMIMALETAMVAPATQPARTIEPVFASDKPVAPKKSLLMALGSVGGLLLGVMSVFLGDVWRRARQHRRTEIS